MSSKNPSDAKQDLMLAGALLLVIVIARFWFDFAQGIVVLIAEIGGAVLLGGYAYGAYWILNRPARRVYSHTGTDVDLSEFGNSDWSKEPDYKWDRLTGEWVEVPESKVQSAPAKQETPPESPLPSSSKSEQDVLDCPLHLADKLTQNQITRVEQNGYLLKEFVPLGKTRRGWYYIQEQKPESFEHTFIVHSLVAKLKPYVQDIEVHRTQQPDIIFYYKGERYALDVETPHKLPHKHARLSRKAQCLTKEYGVRWWFVTTRSAYAKTFARYGEVLTRNQTDQWLQETFSPSSTPPPLIQYNGAYFRHLNEELIDHKTPKP